jgi:hypothetical protein
MNLVERGLNCAIPALYGMSVQNSGPNVWHLSFGAFSRLTPFSKFRKSTKKQTLSFDTTQDLDHELLSFTYFLTNHQGFGMCCRKTWKEHEKNHLSCRFRPEFKTCKSCARFCIALAVHPQIYILNRETKFSRIQF